MEPVEPTVEEVLVEEVDVPLNEGAYSIKSVTLYSARCPLTLHGLGFFWPFNV